MSCMSSMKTRRPRVRSPLATQGVSLTGAVIVALAVALCGATRPSRAAEAPAAAEKAAAEKAAADKKAAESKEAAAASIAESKRWVIASDFTRDGSLLLTAGGESLLYRPGDVVVWKAADGARVGELAGHPTAVWAVKVSADGMLSATGG